jgi:hypothetical protein
MCRRRASLAKVPIPAPAIQHLWLKRWLGGPNLRSNQVIRNGSSATVRFRVSEWILGISASTTASICARALGSAATVLPIGRRRHLEFPTARLDPEARAMLVDERAHLGRGLAEFACEGTLAAFRI